MSFFRQWWDINHNNRCEVTFRSWFDFRTVISFVVLVVKIPNALLVSWPPMQKRRKYILSPFLAAAIRQGFFSVTEEPKRPVCLKWYWLYVTLFETTGLFICHARALQRKRMAARLEPRWTACNPLPWVASPALSTKWIFLSNPEFNSSAISMNSQLVCLFVTFQRIISFSDFLGPLIHQK